MSTTPSATTSKSKYPAFSDDDLFEHARLINAALVAKIHTVEWTTAVISHPTTVRALRTNWWGLAGERIHNMFGRISKSEVISGIPGSPTEHYEVPYALTEEFVAVYRMHPLIPDDFPLRSLDNDALLEEATLRSAVRARAPSTCSTAGRWPTSTTPSAASTRAWCACTTSPASSRSSSDPTA